MNILKKLSVAGTKLCALTVLSFISLQTFAQEKGVDIDINVGKKEDMWYKQPWVWVVGGAVFILLLVAILRGGKKS